MQLLVTSNYFNYLQTLGINIRQLRIIIDLVILQ